MKIDEKFLSFQSDDNLFYFSSIFTLLTSLSATTQQGGQAGGFHLLRYSGRGIGHYRLDLKCLAYENRQLVQNSGNT
jgi:hypothetical protein